MITFLIIFAFLTPADSSDYETKTNNAVRREVRFADRFFVKNTLMEIFGKEVEQIINKNYFKAGKQVGGGCDIYEQVFYTETDLEDPDSECINGKTGRTFPHYPQNTLLRSANILKTCYEIIYQRSLSKDLMKRTHSNIEKTSFSELAFKEFYPYGGNDKLLNLIKAKKKGFFEGTEDFSKKIFFDLCLSPNWQKL
jgi:hypothetical protein